MVIIVYRQLLFFAEIEADLFRIERDIINKKTLCIFGNGTLERVIIMPLDEYDYDVENHILTIHTDKIDFGHQFLLPQQTTEKVIRI